MQPLRGIALKLCAVMLFIIMLSLVKAVSADVPAGQSVFFRSFFAIPVIVVWLLLRGELSIGLRVRSRMGHFWRGVIGTIAMGLNFAAVGFLPLPPLLRSKDLIYIVNKSNNSIITIDFYFKFLTC